LAAVKLLPSALEDLERLVELLRESDPFAASQTAPLIFQGLRVLADHPLIGRPIDVDRRELVIYRGRTGYLAQYSYRVASDEVLITAFRHQREVDE
jgi:plasmid stabilization system protein ParE